MFNKSGVKISECQWLNVKPLGQGAKMRKIICPRGIQWDKKHFDFLRDQLLMIDSWKTFSPILLTYLIKHKQSNKKI